MMLLSYSFFVSLLWTFLCTDGSNAGGTTTTTTTPNVNACAYTTCPSGTTCKMEPGPNCRPGNCPLMARCASPCDTVRCAGTKVCEAIYVNCLAGSTDCVPGLQAKCIPRNDLKDPCEQHTCPAGEGCYTNQTCVGNSCKKEAYCQDPCVHQNTKCNSDEICYPETVTCVKAPCNPIPVCKKPCDTIHCGPGSKCFIPKIGIICTKPICRPHPICQASQPNNGQNPV